MAEPGFENREPEGPKRIAFLDFFAYNNPKVSEYRRFIMPYYHSGAGDDIISDRSFEESFPDDLETFPEIREFLQSKLRGEILIDCGGGREFMRRIAIDLGTGVYVNVDGQLSKYDKTARYTDDTVRVPDKEWLISFHVKLREPRIEQDTQILGVEGEMLDVISRFPSGTCNFSLNGIETMSVIENRDFWQALADEITRTTKQGGTVFGVGTSLFDYLDRKRFRDTGLLTDFPLQGIFERI